MQMKACSTDCHYSFLMSITFELECLPGWPWLKASCSAYAMAQHALEAVAEQRTSQFGILRVLQLKKSRQQNH
jgi:hypothetical protein